MLRDLASLPAIVLFPLFAVVGIGLTLLFDVIMRRVVTPETRERANSTASVTLQVTATIYAILIAFVIVDAYGQIRDTQSDLSAKAAELSVVVANSRAFPDAEGSEIREAALAYARAVVDSGLPELEDTGRPSRPADVKLEALFQTVQRVGESDEVNRVAYQSTLNALDQVIRARESLIDSARSTIPNSLLGLLFVIGFTVMAVATMLDTQHRRSHLFILSSLALVIWLTLALVVSMDYPFNGPVRVTDQPVREFLEFRAAR
jgi:uncharacterized membrane protein